MRNSPAASKAKSSLLPTLARRKYSAAVVGLGYWGPNLARNLSASDDFDLTALVDIDERRRDKVGSLYPAAGRFSSLAEALKDRPIDLVCVATPVSSHASLAEIALNAGANVLVEKPLAKTTAEARALLELSVKVKRKVFVDHTFLYTGAVRELKRHLDSGALGKLLYIDSVRINLGLFQPDVDVVWDLAPHDLAILHHLMGRGPKSVRTMGSCHTPKAGTDAAMADVAYLHLDYGDDVTAHLHLSWLSPVKVRRMIVAGEKQSIIYDDLEPAEKIKIYDHGVSFQIPDDDEARRRLLVSYRKGDMRAPNISLAEAISTELADIASELRGGPTAVASGADGFAIVRVLEAASRSASAGGSKIEVEEA